MFEDQEYKEVDTKIKMLMSEKALLVREKNERERGISENESEKNEQRKEKIKIRRKGIKGIKGMKRMKIKLEDRVTPAGVVGLVVWLCSFMVTSKIVEWYWISPTLALFLMVILGGMLLIFGIEKPSIFKFALDGLAILQDESLTVGQRIALARELLAKVVGVTVNLSEIQSIIDKEEEEKLNKEL